MQRVSKLPQKTHAHTPTRTPCVTGAAVYAPNVGGVRDSPTEQQQRSVVYDKSGAGPELKLREFNNCVVCWNVNKQRN